MNNKVINYFRQHTLATVKTNRLKSKKKNLKLQSKQKANKQTTNSVEEGYEERFLILI